MATVDIAAVLNMLQPLTDQQLEQVVIVSRAILAQRRTRRRRLSVVARSRAQQGIEAPRPRGRRSGSRGQSSVRGLSEQEPQ